MSSHCTKLWGEYRNENIREKATTSEVPDVSEDIEKSMDKFCLAEFDTEYDHMEQKVEHLMLDPMCPLMLYAIELHKHANIMADMINVAKLAIESNVIPPPDAALPIPAMPDIEQKHKLNNLNFLQKDVPSTTNDVEVNIPEISGSLAKEILAKCVATMFAHIGYETTYQSTLDILTDVLVEFLQKISTRLKIASEDEKNHGLTGFPHIEERVLTELGFGGVKGIHEYYVTRIVKYIPILQQRCREFINEYQELLTQYQKLLTERKPLVEELANSIVRIKVEKDDDTLVHLADGDNSQLHLDLLTAFEAEQDLNMEEGQNYWCQQ